MLPHGCGGFDDWRGVSVLGAFDLAYGAGLVSCGLVVRVRGFRQALVLEEADSGGGVVHAVDRRAHHGVNDPVVVVARPLAGEPRVHEERGVVAVRGLERLRVLHPLQVHGHAGRVEGVQGGLQRGRLVGVGDVHVVGQLVGCGVDVRFRVAFRPFVLQPGLRLDDLPAVAGVVALQLVGDHPSLQEGRVAHLPPAVAVGKHGRVQGGLEPLVEAFPVVHLPLFEADGLLLPSGLLVAFVLDGAFGAFPAARAVAAQLVVQGAQLLGDAVPALDHDLVEAVLGISLSHCFSSLLA